MGQLVTEQTAVALYLTDNFPEARLGISTGQDGCAPYLVWLALYAGEVDPVYMTPWLYGDRLDSITLRDQARSLERVSGALAVGPYLLGQQFSTADILISRPFERDIAVAPDNKITQEWLARLNEAPAAHRGHQRLRSPNI
jgi:glutathione S-transferase